MNTVPRHSYADPTEHDDLVRLGIVYCPVQLMSSMGLNDLDFQGILAPGFLDKLQSKLLASPLIPPIIVLYIIAYISSLQGVYTPNPKPYI